MSKVWLTIKVALFGSSSVSRPPLQGPVEYTPYFLENPRPDPALLLANLSAYLLVELYLHFRMKGRSRPSSGNFSCWGSTCSSARRRCA